MERMVEAIPEQEYHQYYHFLSESKWDHVAVNKQTAQSVSAFMSTCKTKNKLPTGLIIDESSHLKGDRFGWRGSTICWCGWQSR